MAAIDTAMVLAAGLGQRMRPITDTLPKPLVEIGGRTMLDHALDRLHEAGIKRAVVNVHHLADQIEAHLKTRTQPQILISNERDALLETGGGVRRALPLLGPHPFLVFNSDSLWIESGPSTVSKLLESWNEAEMDALLLLAPRETSFGYEGRGDFFYHNGALRRRTDNEAPFIFAGVSILNPALFQDTPEGAFSLNIMFDKALAAKRLKGIILNGQYLHVGTPDAIPQAQERVLNAKNLKGG